MRCERTDRRQQSDVVFARMCRVELRVFSLRRGVSMSIAVGDMFLVPSDLGLVRKDPRLVGKNCSLGAF